MIEIFINILSGAIVVSGAFAIFALGQNRMRRRYEDATLNLLIEIRRKNSAHEPLDEWLTKKINPLMMASLKRRVK